MVQHNGENLLSPHLLLYFLIDAIIDAHNCHFWKITAAEIDT